MKPYQTSYWQIDPTHIDQSFVQEAAALLQQQQVVAFPTETVYGLGADATNEEAVQAIFDAKGRPSDNPLIVHVGNKEQVYEVVESIPPMAHALIDAYAPGPLTLIMKSNGVSAPNVTAGLSTVAVRIPDHPVAKALLETANLPLAAPSANRSGRPSPTTAQHVYEDLEGRIAGIVDGGATGIGVESTVVDCTGDKPIILRPGGITKEQIEAVAGPVGNDESSLNADDQPRSPGMKYTHYAPEAPLWLVEGDVPFFKAQIAVLQQNGKKVGVMASEELAPEVEQADFVHVYGSRASLNEVAVGLYNALRSFNTKDVDVILSEVFPEEGMGVAVMNRLRKAASETIVQP
nr:L-threonylcarbamoyladenylate synthase [Pontibacillus halophilus]